MSIKLRLIPRSKATNSWDLLQDLKTIWRREPKRVLMLLILTGDRVEIPYHLRGVVTFPACGAVGCAYGWLKALRRAPHAQHAVAPGEARDFIAAHFPKTARGEIYQLMFYPLLSWQQKLHTPLYPWPAYTWPEHSLPEDQRPRQGTPEYAEFMCRELDRLMKRHPRSLKAFVLPKVGK